MPQLIEVIDRIVRQSGRDALYVVPREGAKSDDVNFQAQEFSGWLDAKGVNWKLAEDFDPEGYGVWLTGGPKCLYIDVDPASDFGTQLTKSFQPAEGSQLLSCLQLKRMTYEVALKHAERDDPEYWDRLF